MENTRVETGRLVSPFGTSYVGFKITVGSLSSENEQTYEDIERILRANRAKFRITEESTPQGKFKSYTVETN